MITSRPANVRPADLVAGRTDVGTEAVRDAADQQRPGGQEDQRHGGEDRGRDQLLPDQPGPRHRCRQQVAQARPRRLGRHRVAGEQGDDHDHQEAGRGEQGEHRQVGPALLSPGRRRTAGPARHRPASANAAIKINGSATSTAKTRGCGDGAAADDLGAQRQGLALRVRRPGLVSAVIPGVHRCRSPTSS